jgi:hypothetical protein
MVSVAIQERVASDVWITFRNIQNLSGFEPNLKGDYELKQNQFYCICSEKQSELGEWVQSQVYRFESCQCLCSIL